MSVLQRQIDSSGRGVLYVVDGFREGCYNDPERPVVMAVRARKIK